MSECPSERIVSIQPASAEHLPEIGALAGVIWRAHYPGIISHGQIEYMLARMYDVEVMGQELASGVAYDRLMFNGALRGFSSYGAASNMEELKLHKLYVHPDFQRRGFGTLLLNHVEAAARERGFTTVVLAVNKRNEMAIAIYRKHGFTIRESVVTEIGGGFVMDDYVMAKLLSTQN